ncbi:MAG: phospholipid carrier-dependent glycosyltransferase [Cyanobacteriota bacterium]|nr:phospholipid carrier-dependent glycosyltransferase [Cyanobacteriota bacterium]
MQAIPFKRQILAGFLGIILFLGIVSYVVNVSVNHDESMYIGASFLSGSGLALYHDFSYVQMPDLPLFYGIFYRLVGVSYYLLATRLINTFFALLSGWAIYKITWTLSKDILVSWSAVVLLEFNEMIIYIMGKASNDIMPLSFGILGFYFFVISFSEQVRPLAFFAAGICLAVATGIKLYYIVIVFPFIGISIVYPKSLGLQERLLKVVFPLLAGLFVGFIPVLYYFFKDLEAFWINNWEYHSLNTKWRELTGYRQTMSFNSKLEFGEKILGRSTNIILVNLIVFMIAIKSLDGLTIKKILSQKLKSTEPSPELILSSSLFAIAVVTTLLPTPLWTQYFAFPIPFAILVIICLYIQLNTKGKIIAKRVLIFLTALTLIFGIGNNRLYNRFNTLLAPSKWKVVAVHRTAQNIRKYVKVVQSPDLNPKIATLAPLYAIEGGLEIYNELSAGPFMYRVGDLMSAEKRMKVKGTSIKTIQSLLDRDPPAAILVGFEGDLDSPLIEYAVENKYTKVKEKFNGGVLYVRRG